MNILYIGSSGALSLIPFKRLLALASQRNDFNIVSVGIDRPIIFNDKIIALENESLALSARQANRPVIDLSQAISETVKHCEDLSVDLILMSCYGKRLPDEIISIARLGCFNMHPSLLPAYRGPEPVFWQMKNGDALGVSWHKVIFDFDAGEIATQKKVSVDDGLTHGEISQQLAEAGADLMEGLLQQLLSGSVSLVQQDERLASYENYPKQSDFTIDTNRDAQQLYNFMCATQRFGFVYRYELNGSTLFLNEAFDYDNNQTLDSAEVQSGKIYIPCNGGVLIASYTDKIST